MLPFENRAPVTGARVDPSASLSDSNPFDWDWSALAGSRRLTKN